MKTFFKILLGFLLVILLIIVGVGVYLDLPVFQTVDGFNSYIQNYEVIRYDIEDKYESIDVFNSDSLLSKKVNEVAIEGEDVLISYFRYKNPFSARRNVNKYKNIHSANLKIKLKEINIPFYGKYWIQTSKGITNISWIRKNRVILISSKSREIAERVEKDLKGYLK